MTFTTYADLGNWVYERANGFTDEEIDTIANAIREDEDFPLWGRYCDEEFLDSLDFQDLLEQASA